MATVRVQRLNGKTLANFVSDAEIEILHSIGDLKRSLAAADVDKPPPTAVRLFLPIFDGANHNGLTELCDDDEIPWQVVATPKTNRSHWLVYMNKELDVQLRGLEEVSNPENIFSEHALDLVLRCRRPTSDMMDAWIALARMTVLSMSPQDLNRVEEDGSTILLTMLKCLLRLIEESDYKHGTGAFEALVLEVVELPALQPRTIGRALNAFGARHFFYGNLPIIWGLVREKKGRYNSRAIGGGSELCADIAVAMIRRAGNLSPQVMDFKLDSGDNLLQYILEPTSLHHAGDKREAEARLCVEFASRCSLAHLLARNAEGESALSYALQLPLFSSSLKGDWESAKGAIIAQVQQQLQRAFAPLGGGLSCDELLSGIEEFQERGGGTLDFKSPLDDLVRSRADDLRRKWMRMGWRFKAQTLDGQLREVMAHHTFEALLKAD